MFLKSLTISSHDEIIRQIVFHNGINLIVDETPDRGTQTGNNVGKTTVLMLVDFCLGGDAKQVYTDPEHKKEEYTLVKEFLFENEVLITLVLKEDLCREDSREIRIERNFLPRKRKIQRIDGKAKTDDEFEETLTDLLFPGHRGKPTLRQIISHNIRYKDQSVTYTLKTLDRFTSDAEYETLYLFLLGVDFDQGDVKQELLTQIGLEQTFKTRLEKNQTKSAYETALAILDGEIELLNRRKANFNLNENFEADLDRLNQVKYQINLISSEIGRLNIRRELITEAQRGLEKGTAHVDLRQLEQIYQQATDMIAGIQKTFADLCAFHNRMIAEKVRYIAKDLPRIESDIKAKTEHLSRLLQDEAELSIAVARSESFAELEKLIAELNEKFRRKGEYENIIQQLTEVEANLKSLNQRLDVIDEALFSDEFEMKIKEQKDKFNRHFAAISKELYGEQYALKVDPTEITSGKNKGKRLYKFSAFNTNFSSGKKQGEISCFDIAYTLFADEENIPCLHFLLNDKKELMHDNQLLKIAQLVNRKGIQFVASILKDKLPEELDKEEYFVVKLSQGDKLFRIEGN
ncbi:DUF2326 domain-containing protein [Geobacter benzoatilyticus]|uniref:DUF2326 domain-containing protein n=1 Tax=Geobacter benzoatilyticus TaxID=2815309 RepID=A0ABX7Q273_9BACT|nr:DUF2326 domain-containing protein [Geobacter benzoatilyticus]QSV45439.1 DUF2326 domain-containing protein [Geobacter benzoatilyticus]